MLKTPRSIILFAFIIISFITCACSDNQPKLTPLTAGATILTYGDSLTSGAGTTVEYSYPSVLSNITGFKVINAGVPGDVTQGGLERLPEALEEYQPDFIILCLGGNDMLRKIPNETTKNNLIKMIQLIQAKQIPVLLIGVPKPSIILEVPDFYQEIADQFNIPLDTKLLPELLGTQKYKSDPIHLNQQGYKLFAEGIANLLKQYGAIRQ